jgi:hypothetical protein
MTTPPADIASIIEPDDDSDETLKNAFDEDTCLPEREGLVKADASAGNASVTKMAEIVDLMVNREIMNILQSTVRGEREEMDSSHVEDPAERNFNFGGKARITTEWKVQRFHFVHFCLCEHLPT